MEFERLSEESASDLGALKQALHQFAERRAGLPAARHAQVRADFAEVFLALLHLADRLNVDIITAAEELIDRRATVLPAVAEQSRRR